jgi:hypothetical protein
MRKIILPAVTYYYDTSILTPKEHGMKVFHDKLLRLIFPAKRDQVTTENKKKIHKELLHISYSSINIIK